MAENKTTPHDGNVQEYISSLENEQQRLDSKMLVDMMHEISGEQPVMWGTGIIGFGQFTYTYASGQTGIWPPIAFAPRKGMLSLYITVDASKFAKELEAVGKHKVGKGCIYIKQLADVDTKALKVVIQKAYDEGFLSDQT